MDHGAQPAPRALDAARGASAIGTPRDGHDLFYIGDDNKAIICTDEVKAFVEERGWTNVGFLEAGETI